jgi:transcriptional regulator GlxA family with amidase domain
VTSRGGAAALVHVVLILTTACGSPTAEPEPAGPSGWPRPSGETAELVGRRLNAGFLVVDGVYNSELMAPYDIFHHTPFHTEPLPGIEVFTVSADGAPVTTFEGLVITPHHSFATAPPIDILVVPSAEGSMDRDLENREMLDWVRDVGGRAQWVISLCDGAFVLAAAGLLDGHRATTFPGDQDRFAEAFPRIELRRGVSFVHDGRMITSEGGAKSYDPALWLVHYLYGEEVARRVGRGLILPWPPPAGAMQVELRPAGP